MKKSITLLAGISKAAREAKNLLILTDVQKEILLGVTLGDATIRREGKVKFEQTIRQKDYIDHLYAVFKDFVTTPPQIRKITGGGAKDRESIWFQTYTHPIFKQYRELFYRPVLDESGNIIVKGKSELFKKGIPDSTIEKNIIFLKTWLTPRALAYWFMDDGTTSRNKNTFCVINFVLCTHGFTKEETEFLLKILKEKYAFSCSLGRDDKQYFIRILKESVEPFRSLVLPYVLPSFKYKIIDLPIS